MYQMTSPQPNFWSMPQLLSRVIRGSNLSLLRSQQGDAEWSYQNGLLMLEKGDLKRAEDNLTTAVTLQPDHVLAHQALGQLYVLQGQWSRLLDTHSTLRELDPPLAHDLGQWIIAQAQELFDREQPDATLRYLDPLSSLSDLPLEQQITVAHLRGRSYGKQGNWGLAVESLQQVIELCPEHDDAHHECGIAWAAMGEYDLAIQSFNSALSINFYRHQTHFYLGESSYRKGDLSKAIQAFQTAIRIAAEPDADLYASLGLAYIHAGDQTDAGIYLTKALGRDISCLDAHYGMALMLMEQGDYEAARARFTFILDEDPQFLKAEVGLGLIYLAEKKTQPSGRKVLKPSQIEAASRHFEAVLSQDQTVAEAHFGKGEIYRLHRKLRQAIMSYERALQLNGSLTLAHYKLGKALAASMRVDEAIQSLTQAHQLNPHCEEIKAFLDQLQTRQDTLYHHTGISFHHETQMHEILGSH